jgi:uncharacterized repeat protein (TIGR01451 family)
MLAVYNEFATDDNSASYGAVEGVSAQEETDTPIPPSDTPIPTDTPVPPSDTPVPTDTPIPPTDTPIPTDTKVPPTDTPIPTDTSVPPTKTPKPTKTSVPPTNTPKPTKTETPKPTLTPTPTNKPPWIDLDSKSSGTGYDEGAFLRGGPAVSIVSLNLDVGDPDGNKLKKAIIKISNRKDGPSEELAINTSVAKGTNITANFNSSTGTLTLSGTDSLANYRKVLRTVTYRNTKNEPDPTVRQITFQVTDTDNANSNKPISKVKIVFPQIKISKTTKTPIISKGATAKFTITVDNTGNATLTEINVTDILAPDCSRTNLTSLSPSDKPVKIDCELTNVTEEFINFAEVTAVDQYGNFVSDSDSVTIELLNPNIQVVKSPTTQTILRGEKARFKIFVINTSDNVSLTDVAVVDPLVPQCDAEIGNLGPGKSKEYDCVSDAVDVAFINEITASGKNIFNGEDVSDGSRAFVEILDLKAEIMASPVVIEPGAGSADFTIDVTNRGSVPFTIKTLNSDKFGAIHNADNPQLENNSCSDARNAEIQSGKTYTCHFTTDKPTNQGVYTYDLTVNAKDEENNAVSAEAAAELIIANTSLLAASLQVSPSSLPAPGGLIKEKLTISNQSAATVIDLDVINHNTLQSLNKSGNCSLPQTLQPSTSYSCEVEVGVTGVLNETISHRVTTTGLTPAGVLAGSSAAAEILIYDPNRQVNWVPIIAVREAYPEEDNDVPCSAYSISTGNNYQFAIDDKNDWYVLDVKTPGPVTIQINDMHSTSAQVAVYASNVCSKIVSGDLVSFNGDDLPTKTLTFNAATTPHYLWIYDPDADARSIDVPYSVRVQMPR